MDSLNIDGHRILSKAGKKCRQNWTFIPTKKETECQKNVIESFGPPLHQTFSPMDRE